MSAGPIPLTDAQARQLRAADALVRRLMDAAAIDAARHKVAVGEAMQAGRALVDDIVTNAGGDVTLDWQVSGNALSPVARPE